MSLTKVYPGDVLALDSVNLTIEQGDFLALVGPSGSGKTTLLNILGGLDRHYKGSLKVDGVELKGMKDNALSHYRNTKVGFVFQSFHLLPDSTLVENVSLPSLFGNERRFEAIRNEAIEVLKLVELENLASSYPTRLSAGERQRVAIARAMFNKPKLLLCDEPTGNLDKNTARTIIEIFERLNNEGVALVIATHADYVAERARRVVYLEKGKVVREEKRGKD
jgi:putative ABC transport system ATP-binding protein